jgi:penicillin V acylase-like amidase (Ntn superfamily)
MHTSRHLIAAAVAAGLAAILVAPALDACTTFCVASGGRVIFGRNYDFDFGRGMMVVNPRGLLKSAMVPGGARWTAHHGSVTFNQFGRDFPMGGMNEAGLVVELMWHDRAEYPAADSRAPVGVLEWIQYELDTAATVDDVLRSDRVVRISGQVPLHYLVADAAGRAATIEFVDGALHSRSGAALPARVLANDSYDDALAFWREQKGRRARGDGSHARFARAADALTRFPSTSPAAIERAFEILADVAQRNTRWSIVYDQVERTIRFRTAVHRPIRFLAMKPLELGCNAGARIVDVNAALEGDIAGALERYTDARNRALVAASHRDFSGTRHTPPDELERTAMHPSEARCSPSYP